MSTQPQIIVLGKDGNLWLETGPFTNVSKTLARRVQIDANVSNLYSQVGEKRIWRTGFQALNAGEVFVLDKDNNLWLEHAPFNAVPPARTQVDANVETFQAMDLGTVFVLGTDGNLWLVTAPFSKIPPPRQQIDSNVLAFQALDINTVFVLGRDGNLWLETAPFDNVPPRRKQVDANVIQFWAMDSETVYVLGSDRHLWFETGTFEDMEVTLSDRVEIACFVNDFKPLRISSQGQSVSRHGSSADMVFILDHVGNLWSAQGPYQGGEYTLQTRQFVDSDIVSFGAVDQGNIFVISGDLNLWNESSPFGQKNRQQVDGNVVACQPLNPEQLFISKNHATTDSPVRS
jgi:hypothetical protein